MTEKDWLVALTMHLNGWSFKRIEQHFGAGHGRIKKGLAARGLLAVPKVSDRQRSPARTSSNWHPHQEVVAQFLAQRKRSPEFIASVVNRPVAEVEKFVRSAA